MEKKKVIWTRKANIQLFSIMDYYAERNKSDFYSLKLESEINLKLGTLDFTVTLPQKTSIENLFYFTHNHISVFFIIENNSIIVKFVIDERRNPKSINVFLSDLD